MSGPYTRSDLSPFTRASAEQVNAELIKIEAAFATLQTQIDNIVAGTPLAAYTWVAFADSADGTANFTTGEPGERNYIGIAYGRGSPVESIIASDYIWTRFRGGDGADGSDGTDGTDGTDGADGEDGTYRDFKFKRSAAVPATPIEAAPSGWTDDVPSGTDTIWFTVAVKNSAGQLLSSWSLPARLTTTTPRGPYDAGVTYHEGDIVTFNGSSYILTVEESVGNAPSGTNQPNAYWDVFAAAGGQGEPSTPPSAFSATIDLTSSSSGANLRTLADTAGYTGLSDATITFRVPSGVLVQGLGGGGKGIDTGTWPDSAYTIDIDLVVQGGGKVYGGGGRGGNGGSGSYGEGGFAGGDAIYCRTPLDITIDSSGEVKAGGGGGGGGNGSMTGFPEPVSRGGGGGGGGFPNGSGGGAGSGDTGTANAGSPGTVSGGGAGGSGASGGGTVGGAGGGAATAGSSGGFNSGGAAGYAVRKNGLTVPVTNNGTMTGTAA